MANERDSAPVSDEAARIAAEDAIRNAKAAASDAASPGKAAVDDATRAARMAVGARDQASREAVGTTARLSEDASRRFGAVLSVSARASEDVGQRTREAIDIMAECGTALGDGFQAIAREWADYAQGVMQRNASGFNALLQARTLHDVLSAQSDRLRQEAERFLDTSARVSELSAKATQDAYHRLHAQVERQGNEAA